MIFFFNKKKRGFIIIFALMVISLIVYLTQQLISGVFVSTNFVSIVEQREQAKLLALGGVQVAIKQLLELDEDDKEKKNSGNNNNDKNADQKNTDGMKASVQGEENGLSPHDKKFFDQIFPLLNRWRQFSFEEKRDGFAAQLKLCLVSEEGKININEAFDFKKQEFKKEYAALLKSLEIKGKLQAGELATKLQDFLSKRARKLEDISELMELSSCKNLDLFYKPPELPVAKGEEPQPSLHLALADIFTVWTSSFEVNPLLFSNGLCAMFTFRQPLATDPEKMKERFAQFKQQFKPEFANDWDASWDTLQLLYDKKPVFFKEMQGIFSKEFWPVTYSVISYATVGRVTQRLVAVVKKVELPRDDEKKEEMNGVKNVSDEAEKQSDKNKKKFEIKILRLYWV